jgi:hypothetical protein
MTQPRATATDREAIFISYRRIDSHGYVEGLAEKLMHHFGHNQIYVDVIKNHGGDIFPDKLRRQVLDCQVFLAVIGKEWVRARAKSARRRSDPEIDWVYEEVGLALANDKNVIPVLVGAMEQLPPKEDLPENLHRLHDRHCKTLRGGKDYPKDLDELIQELEVFVSPLPHERPLIELVVEELNAQMHILETGYKFQDARLREILDQASQVRVNDTEGVRKALAELARRVKTLRTSLMHRDPKDPKLQHLRVPEYDLFLPFKDSMGTIAAPSLKPTPASAPA